MKYLINKIIMRIAALSILLFVPLLSKAESAAPSSQPVDYMSFFILGLITFILLTLVYLLYVLKVFVDQTKPAVKSKPLFAGILAKLSDSVPVEKEEAILTDHDYDGIRELDNNLPLWWKYMFYATIVFAGFYLYYYHFSGSGKLQIEEYEHSLMVAEKEIEEYRKKSANSIDESNVTLLKDAKEIDSGKMLYLQNCAACHGKAGEGVVGPNLTDAFWIHGGSVKDVFKTIKYGVQENGMKSWKAELSPKNIQEITSYIKTLEGTNPPNGKAPQGDKYEEKKEVAEN
jgi:cytochrome c oxidase cbb3-type subunit III